jgi:hypothetical protein
MRRRTARAAGAVLTCAIGLTACSSGGDDTSSGTRPRTSASAGTDEEVTTQTAIATVTGRLAQDQRDALTAAVTQVVDGWLEGAYLGEFPRTDFSAAFAAFTAGAAAKAQRELPLLSNAAISDRIRTAEATRRSVSLDVLAVRQRPVGVTARVDLAFETTGELAGPQQVTGTLDLTPDGGGWKVFGFDVTRTPVPAAPASAALTSESAS